MKLLLTSAAIALASSTLAAAAPTASQPAPAAVSAVSAPAADRLALARRFVALSDPAGKIVDMFRLGFGQVGAEELPDDAERLKAEARVTRMLARVEPAVQAGMPNLLEAYAQAYAREFSAEELTGMVAFAQSPGGARYLRDYIKLEEDEAVLDATSELMEGVMPAVEDMRKELCADRAAQRIAAGDVKAKCPLSEPDVAAG